MPSIDPARSRARLDPSDEAPPPTTRAEGRRAPPVNDHAVDARIIEAVRFNDRVLHVGMNARSVGVEVAALGPGVTVIAGASTREVKLGPNTFDITTTAGVRGFVQQLATENGLSLQQCGQLEGILLGSPASGRDEVAQMAAAWAPAERGASIPSRLVLSGHSSFGMLWGDNDTGTVHFQAVRDLGRVLTKAAAQVEDVHISGCYSEAEVQGADKWTASFPNLKTIWGYSGFSPSPAANHIADWRAATSGRTARLGEAFVAAHGSATAWSVAGGIANASSTLAERQQAVSAADERFDGYFSGRARITSSHDPAADRDYGAYQMLAAHRDTAPAERAHASTRGGQMLRLRFWETSVRGEIASRYGAKINEALRTAGLEPVDFRNLSRADAVRTLERYREVTGALGPIMTGIYELSPNVVPATFCH